MKTRNFAIYGEHDQVPTHQVNGAELARDNADDVDLVEALEALELGGELSIGGGAAPLVRIRRLS